MQRNDRSFTAYLREDAFAPSTSGSGAMGVAGDGGIVKIDLPIGSSKPAAPEYRKKNKQTLAKLKMKFHREIK